VFSVAKKINTEVTEILRAPCVEALEARRTRRILFSLRRSGRAASYFFSTNVDRRTVLVALLNHSSTVTRSGAATENCESVTAS
jgi:hypothetical protein